MSFPTPNWAPPRCMILEKTETIRERYRLIYSAMLPDENILKTFCADRLVH